MAEISVKDKIILNSGEEALVDDIFDNDNYIVYLIEKAEIVTISRADIKSLIRFKEIPV